MSEVNLMLGDCLERMAEIETGSVDAVVTDPPFGIGFDYSGTKEETSTPESYWEWLAPKYAEALRCLKPGGFIAVWQAQLNFRHFWDWFGDDIHIYAACKNFVQLRKTPINYGYDPVVMRYDRTGDAARPPKPKRNMDFFVANTASIVSDTTRPERAHPCPRPLDQVTAIVENFVTPGGCVLDPFMGSGTTGVACVNTGRSFVGIERDLGYFAIAERRIAEARSKTSLLEATA